MSDGLRDLLQDGSDPPPPLTPAGARTIVQRQRTLTRAAGFALLLVAALGVRGTLLRGPSEAQLTPRGGDTVRVALTWSLEGSDDRPDPVPTGARVLFVAKAEAAGFGCLEEEAGGDWTRLLPASGEAWPLRVGSNVAARGDRPQAFSTDAGPGRRAYRLLFDPEDPGCAAPAARATVELSWSASPSP